MWASVNQLANAAFDLWIWPFQGLPAFWQACATAVPVTVFALLVFRYASNQRAIHAVKDKIKAHLLELWLYRDDLRVTLLALWAILGHTLVYMGHALLPMAVMIVPLALVIVQVESRFAFRGLDPGESSILKVTLGEDTPLTALEATLTLPPGLVQETPALRLNRADTILWRIRALSAGQHDLRVMIGGERHSKRVSVAAADAAVSPRRLKANDIEVLLYPRERPIPAQSLVTAIELTYPRDRGEFAGLSTVTWWLLAISLLLGYPLRRFFGVTF